MLPPGAMTLMAAEPGAAHPFPLFDVFPQRFLLRTGRSWVMTGAP